MTVPVATLVLLSSLLHVPHLNEDGPEVLRAASSTEISSQYLFELGTTFLGSEIEISREAIGDRHPNLFGITRQPAAFLWQPPIRDSLIFETSRNLIRRQLFMDRDYGIRGYSKGVYGQKKSQFCTASHPTLLPLPLGGFDLCLLDPLLDAPLVPLKPCPSTDLRKAIWLPRLQDTHHQILAWPRWDSGEDWIDSSPGGIQASMSWNAYLPQNHRSVTFQMTANIDAEGQKGCLFQFCWQGSPRSP